MIGYFPNSYPDELLYSLLARLRSQLAFPSNKTFVREVFGIVNVMAVVDLPGHLDSLCRHLPSEHAYSANQMIDAWTLFPYYEPFLPPERAAQIRTSMKGDDGSSIHAQIGIMASSVRQINHLQACKECIKGDEEEWKERYWHRRHQLPGVMVCPIHGIPLFSTNVPYTNARTRYVYIPACVAELGESSGSATNWPKYSPYLHNIACQSAYLLDNPRSSFSISQLREGYRLLLQKAGFMTTSGRLRVGELLGAFRSHYTDVFLENLNCAVHTQLHEPWLLRIARSKDDTHHPLKHILLITFLGETVETFFAQLEQHKHVNHVEAFPTATTSSFVRSERKEVDVEGWRVAWKSLCNQYPTSGVKAIRQKAGGLYTKLYRYDRDWLHANSPRKQQKRLYQRVDWDARDNELASHVAQAAELILTTQGRPRQITRTELGKRIGAAAIIQRHIAKLPETQKVIQQVVESREVFAIRRIQWAVQQYQQEGYEPKTWEIARRAHVTRLWQLPVIQHALLEGVQKAHINNHDTQNGGNAQCEE